MKPEGFTIRQVMKKTGMSYMQVRTSMAKGVGRWRKWINRCLLHPYDSDHLDDFFGWQGSPSITIKTKFSAKEQF